MSKFKIGDKIWLGPLNIGAPVLVTGIYPTQITGTVLQSVNRWNVMQMISGKISDFRGHWNEDLIMLGGGRQRKHNPYAFTNEICTVIDLAEYRACRANKAEKLLRRVG